jgi:hypothetical protein
VIATTRPAIERGAFLAMSLVLLVSFLVAGT